MDWSIPLPDRNAPMARLTASAYLMVQIVRIYYGIVKNNLCILEPVSYTHLDVYKRQGETVVVEEGCPVKKFGILLAGRGKSYKTDSRCV